MKKLLAVLLLALVLVACGGEKSVSVTGTFETAHAEGEAYQTATVTLVDGKFTEVAIDEYYPAKENFKKALGADYGMVKASPIGKEWFEQIAALEQWMIGKTLEEVLAMPVYAKDDSHPTCPDVEELKSSCTMNVGSYLEAVKGAAAAAK